MRSPTQALRTSGECQAHALSLKQPPPPPPAGFHDQLYFIFWYILCPTISDVPKLIPYHWVDSQSLFVFISRRRMAAYHAHSLVDVTPHPPAVRCCGALCCGVYHGALGNGGLNRFDSIVADFLAQSFYTFRRWGSGLTEALSSALVALRLRQ